MLLNIKTFRTILHLPCVDELKQFVDPSVLKYFRVYAFAYLQCTY